MPLWYRYFEEAILPHLDKTRQSYKHFKALLESNSKLESPHSCLSLKRWLRNMHSTIKSQKNGLLFTSILPIDMQIRPKPRSGSIASSKIFKNKAYFSSIQQNEYAFRLLHISDWDSCLQHYISICGDTTAPYVKAEAKVPLCTTGTKEYV